MHRKKVCQKFGYNVSGRFEGVTGILFLFAIWMEIFFKKNTHMEAQSGRANAEFLK